MTRQKELLLFYTWILAIQALFLISTLILRDTPAMPHRSLSTAEYEWLLAQAASPFEEACQGFLNCSQLLVYPGFALLLQRLLYSKKCLLQIARHRKICIISVMAISILLLAVYVNSLPVCRYRAYMDYFPYQVLVITVLSLLLSSRKA